MSEKKLFINDAEKIIPAVNDSPYKRILAIGDVHAAFDKLLSLWEKISVTEDDLVIFLGDYLYGLGDKNVETLHWLIEHRKQKNIIFLRGNVDETYLHHLFDSNGKIHQRLNSGVARDIKIAAIKEPYLPREVQSFLKDLPLCHCETIGGRKYFFCHAGIKLNAPLDRQPKTYLLDHENLLGFYENYSGDAVIVVGHKSPKKISAKLPRLFANASEKLNLSKPTKVPGKNIVMLDTHAKEDGRLSCVDVLSGEMWQNDTAPVDSILFVCAGNTCRSPMAKYIMRHLLAQKDLSGNVLVDSAGCGTHGGSQMSRKAQVILDKERIPRDAHVSKQFTRKEYDKFKCIIALDEYILLNAKIISKGDPDNKIRLFTDADGYRLSVEDPYPDGDYWKTYKNIRIGCSSLIDELFG